MATNNKGAELHRRFCLGEKLTEAERVELEVWYAKMYAEEFEQLGIGSPLQGLDELRRKTEQTEQEIAIVNQQVKELFRSNGALKEQNETLRKIIFEKLQPKRA